MEKILVVATHPDDETFGAGGYLLKKKFEGHKTYVLNITHMSIEAGYSEEQIKTRNQEISKMKDAYNLDGYYNLGLKPAMLESYRLGELIRKISDVFNEIEPNTVILPFRNDVHSDHRVAFDACYACTKTFRYPYVKKILMMETPSETDFALPQESFKPNYFVDISDYIETKVRIASIFNSEILEHPFPRSKKNIFAYGTIRGACSNSLYAEAFEIIKIIE